ncbi:MULTISPECIES: DUF4249 domain-containing protein [unclassified Spirosoma]|uniref:DUF4249 domain-containing protein n=1 Tax=unclassified Spirosoma TaxID=2621999 RepID=UPI0009616174|nr:MULTISPECIES: DUF4249 domain-containing protein [unclassified Spirosoma]MBN8826763.1 DUF4249 domain-containing protein [Spirosoma sp.]OJW71159.1 MAG: hypothetical protein BGO59_27880 [Spirosoma sp. 48-14]
MRSATWQLLLGCLLGLLPLACVDPEELLLRGTVDIIVVEGTITNRAEPQLIRINRSKADPLTGRFGTTPMTKAKVEVVVDSAQIIPCHETQAGSYQLPADFKGQIGHAYQLRFVLPDGSHYQSNQQIMLSVPPIQRIYAQFNPESLAPGEAIGGSYRAAHDFFLDAQDPAGQSNYYRWEWTLWEKQDWCRSCAMGVYSINTVLSRYSANGAPIFVAGDSLLEDCFYPPATTIGLERYFVYDYSCRSQCWAVIHSHQLNVFADTYTNGSLLTGRKVAQIPYYQHASCLVEIRQTALNPQAYQYFKQFEEQTQKTGSLADSPPAALGGNIHNRADAQEGVVGYFTASAVSSTRYWLDRTDATKLPLGASDPAGASGLPGAELFYALNGRQPNPEPSPPNTPTVQILYKSLTTRPFTAICESNENQTPVKPEGWRD